MASTKHRLIATVLVNNGIVVQTRKFKRTNMVGNAFTAVDFFNSWSVDEIIVLDISNSSEFDFKFLNIIEELSKRCFVPLSVGGKIANIEHVRKYTYAGADKIVVNTQAFLNPKLIMEITNKFGRQSCIVSIDVKSDTSQPSGYAIATNNGCNFHSYDAMKWALNVQKLGAGEVMVNNVDYDGDKRGYDLVIMEKMSNSLNIPVIAMGGVGKWQDLHDGIIKGRVDAVAAGNIFHYTEHSTKKAKEYLQKAGINVRVSDFYKINMPRKQKYRPFQ